MPLCFGALIVVFSDTEGRVVNEDTASDIRKNRGPCATRRNTSFVLRRNLHSNYHYTSIMAGFVADDQDKEEKLKAALWYAMGQTIDAVATERNINATPHFIGGLSEMVWGQIQIVAQDLEAFAKHRGKTSVNADDVVLLSRRNEALAEVLSHEANNLSRGDGAKNAR